MPDAPPPSPAAGSAEPAPPSRARLLSGSGPTPRTAKAAGPVGAAATRPSSGTQPQRAAVDPGGLPRWAKGVVIGGVLLAVAMPSAVLLSRSMLVQEVLMAESSSSAALVCTGGQARAVDGSSLTGWLFGGSFFSCGEWETRDARVQRERDRAHENYMARERARQRYGN